MSKKNTYYLAVTLSLLASVCATVIPYCLQQFIDSANPLALSNPYIIGIVLLFVAQLLIQIAANSMIAHVAAQKVTELRSQLVSRVIHGQMADVAPWNSGVIASRIVNDVSEVREYWATYLPNVITGICILIVSLGFLIRLDWKLTGILLLTLPILAVIIAPLSGLNHRMTSQYQAQQATFTAQVVESVQNLIAMKANQEEEAAAERLDSQAQEIGQSGFRLDRMAGMTTPLVMFVLFGAVGVIFTYGGLRVSQGTLSTGTLIAFLVYLFQLLSPISALSNFFNEKAKVDATYESLQSIMAIEAEKDTGTLAPEIGELVFHGVSFAYGDVSVINHVSLTVQPYSKVAFVGPTGSGKTTIMNLLLRLYEPTQGEIKLASVPIQQLCLHDYRRLFAYVTQAGGVMSGTIHDNLGGQNEKPEAIEQALRDAQLWEDIQQMPDGIHTVVGERGSRLSGGQRQRLMIAKALLKDTPYLIFDEATSNLDVETETKLQLALAHLRGNKTLLMVAHRLTTIVDADCIYFVEDGRITGNGTHEELLKTHPTYAAYIQSLQVSSTKK